MELLKAVRRKLLYVVMAIGLLSLAVACQGGATPTPTERPELSVDELLSRVGESLAALSSVRFRMTDEMQTGAEFFGQTLKGVEGEVSASDSMRILVDVESAAFGFVEIEIVAAGEQAYMKFSKDAPWAPLDLAQVPFNFTGMGVTLSELVPLLEDATIAGRESVGGAQAIRVEGFVASEDLSDLITSADSGHAVMLTLWIDEDEHTLQQLRLTGKVFDDDGPETMRLIVITEFNVPIEIQLPESASQP